MCTIHIKYIVKKLLQGHLSAVWNEGAKTFLRKEWMGLNIFSQRNWRGCHICQRKNDGAKTFLGLNISHLPLCKPINLEPSLRATTLRWFSNLDFLYRSASHFSAFFQSLSYCDTKTPVLIYFIRDYVINEQSLAESRTSRLKVHREVPSGPPDHHNPGPSVCSAAASPRGT